MPRLHKIWGPNLKKLMKNMNRILLAAVVTVALGSLSQVAAQSQMSGPNGLAASPKVRQALGERPVPPVLSAPKALPVSSIRAYAPALAASPRVQQMLRDNAKSAVAAGSEVVVASNLGNSDGIAASPKLREQLNERPMRFQIAPLK